MGPPPKAVFLDVGWTLVHPRRPLWTVLGEIVRESGGSATDEELERLVHGLAAADRKRAVEAFRSGAEYTDSDEAFRQSFAAMGRIVFRASGLESDHGALTERTLQRFWELSNWEVFPDVVPALRRLRDRGIPVIALSNATTELAGFLDRIGLTPHLDHLVISAEEGIKKPDPRIFRVALNRAGVEAPEAVHVGDMYLEDVLGARGLGIRPFLMDRGPDGMFPHHREPRDDGDGDEPVAVLRSLTDLLDALCLGS